MSREVAAPWETDVEDMVEVLVMSGMACRLDTKLMLAVLDDYKQSRRELAYPGQEC